MPERRRLVSFLLVFAGFAISAAAFPHLPSQVPTHWGLSGKPDAFGGRIQGAFTLPAVMLGAWLLLSFVPRYDRLLFINYDPADSDTSTVRPVYDQMVVIVLAVLLAFHTFAMTSSLGVIGTRRQPLLIAILASAGAIAIGNYLPRVTRRNAFIGFRVPWAYASEEIWRRTQRASGYGMVAAGIIGLVGATSDPVAPMKPFFMAMLTQIIVVAIYSYYLAHSRSAS
jgi:uncharacterized membrane protein